MKTGAERVGQIRVLLVDTSDCLTEVVSEWLVSHPGVEIAGRARSGDEAMERVVEQAPDLVLIGSTLPDMSRFGLTRRIKADPAAPVVVMTTLDPNRAIRAEATAAGADACIGAPDIAERLMPIIGKLLELTGDERAGGAPAVSPPGPLTRTETVHDPIGDVDEIAGGFGQEKE